MIDVHLFDDDGTWVVAATGAEQRFDSRSDAFRSAKARARELTPSRIVNGPPAVRSPSTATETETETDPTSLTAAEDPALARLGPRARAAYERARVADEAGGSDAAPPEWDGDDGSVEDGPPPTGEHEQRLPATTDAGPREPGRVPCVEDDRDWTWARLAGPPELGRSVILSASAEVPNPWADCDEVLLDTEGLHHREVLAQVRDAFLARTPMVYRVDADQTDPPPSSVPSEVWKVPVDFEAVRDAVWHLVLANSVDARDLDRPLWPLARRAREAGASRSTTGDVALADGRVALCDGGPLRFWPDGVLGLPDGTSAVVIPRVTIDAASLDPSEGGLPVADLAPDQLASVGDDTARSRIVAPAGSGKTRVLTERARHLIRSQHVPARSVCLVAFNKRAQEEMRGRTRDLPGLQVQTLNALALSILNGTGTFLTRAERVTTIDELQVRRLLSDLVSFPRRANTDPAAAWLDALSMVRLGLRDPVEVEAELNGDVDGFATFFDDYRTALANQGVVDFDDQIYRAIELLLRDPAVRAAAQASCRVLLVDEFQDLTPAHLLLIRLLAGPEGNVFGVGDDDQTIYGYSGARPDWLIDFDRYFPGATHHALEVNYRCPPAVVTAASNLLSHNRRRVPKEIRPGPQPDVGEAIHVVFHEQPVVATLDRIIELIDAGVATDDIIVLTRVNTLLAPLQAALHEAGIPVRNREGGRFLERTGVAAALSWVRLATATKDLRGSDIERAARRPGRSLSPRMIEWMAEQRDIDGLRRLAGRMQEKDRPKVEGFATDVERIARLATTAGTDRLIEFVRSDIGLDRAMQTLDAAHRGRNSAAHSDDLRALIALGALHPDPTDFERWLRDALDGGRDDDGVQLSTVHRVKGLEWHHVIVHDASTGSFPHRLSTDVEEERRVFHVAITRCQTGLTIVADREIPSMFLAELTAPAPPVADRDPETVDGSGLRSRPTSARRVPKDFDLPARDDLEVEWAGYPCRVAEIDATGVVLMSGRAKFVVAFGSSVYVDGRERRLVAAASTTAGRSGGSRASRGKGPRHELDPSAEPVFAALKVWRIDRAKTDGVPAFVVFSDATLEEIATARPSSAEELLDINGIGPAKLERYGDEVLGVIDDAAPTV